MAKPLLSVALLLVLVGLVAATARSFDEVIRMPGSEWKQEEEEEEEENGGIRWALLVAGSSGYGNYRHQADVCHAYQIMRANGLKDENIVVMMYDDIAQHRDNPEPGKIINHPQGPDVYHGVPKDYTGEAVTASNLYAVILGDKNATSGGSGKVIASGPDDHVFIFYSDHGGPGVLGMPTYPYVYANDLVDVLKKKHERKGFKEMVVYVEACESGSIFEGLLPEGLGIYVTTAANAVESSWGTYCPGDHPGPPWDYLTCLGDLYSVSWMEDSQVHNLKKETLFQQYLTVKDRTSNHNTYQSGSHVMQYGDVKLNSKELSWFIGFDPANVDLPSENSILEWPSNNAINQRDADLLHLWHKYNRAREGTKEKKAARKELMETMLERMVIDRHVDLIGKLLFGSEAAAAILPEVRASGQPLVDDWECLKSMVLAYESKCGKLGEYGMKHMRAFANICNKGVPPSRMSTAAEAYCSGLDVNQ